MKALSERLSGVAVKAIYTSPLERAVATANVLAGPYLLAPTVCESLGEMHFGEWEGMTFRQLNERPEWCRFNTVRSMVKPPGGELMIEVQSRMTGEMEKLRAQHHGETVAIVSHADPIKTVVAHYLGCSLDMLSRFEISPASLTAVRFVDEIPTLLCVNCMDANAL